MSQKVKILSFDTSYAEVERLNTQDWLEAYNGMGKHYSDVDLYCNIEYLDSEMDMYSDGPYYIVSDKLRNLLEEYLDHILIFKEVDVQNHHHSVHLINFKEHYDCINFKESDLTLFKDHVMGVERLVLDDDKIPNCPIFFIDKSFAHIICFSNQLVNFIEKSGCKIPVVSTVEFWV